MKTLNTLIQTELTLLYVEDHQQTRSLTQTILQQYFKHVLVAINGQDGLHQFQNHHIDLIITDMDMPILDGISMIKAIRIINQEIPILIVSAHQDGHYLMESLQHNIQGYILKPLQKKQFIETLSKVQQKILTQYAEKERSNLQKQYQKITDDSSIISKTNPQGIITYVNDAFCKTSGYKRDELIGRSHNVVRYPHESEETFKELWRTISKEKKTWRGIIKNQTKQGEVYYVQTTISPILTAQGSIKEFIASRIVITDIIDEQDNNTILNMVKKAINSSNIISYFQPIVDNKTQKIIKYESLVRLIDEQNNVILPHIFLQDIKNLKYHTEVTCMVLENSFKALKYTDVSISINISMLDIINTSIHQKVFTLLEQHKAETHRITFELLENENVNDTTLIKSFIDQLRAYHVQIAIDDFGVGYSNFQRIMQYKPDIIKIDASLTKNILHDSYSKNMIEAIIMFAKKENILTIAEYVENKEIFDLIYALGVDYSQGYYFGKPEVLFS